MFESELSSDPSPTTQINNLHALEIPANEQDSRLHHCSEDSASFPEIVLAKHDSGEILPMAKPRQQFFVKRTSTFHLTDKKKNPFEG